MNNITEEQRKIIQTMYIKNGGSPKKLLTVLHRSEQCTSKYDLYRKICRPIVHILTPTIIKVITESCRAKNKSAKYTLSEKAKLVHLVHKYPKSKNEYASSYWICMARRMHERGFPLRNWFSINRMYYRTTIGK